MEIGRWFAVLLVVCALDAEAKNALDAAVEPSLPQSTFWMGVEHAEQLLKVLAYLTGGLWVYFNYFRGRTHRPRLEIQVKCEPLRTQASVLLRVVASAKNTGLSMVALADKGSGVIIKGYDVQTGRWQTLEAHSILTTHHHWIEPGETVVDEILVRADSLYSVFCVELRLNSPAQVTWAARTIVGTM